MFETIVIFIILILIMGIVPGSIFLMGFLIGQILKFLMGEFIVTGICNMGINIDANQIPIFFAFMSMFSLYALLKEKKK